jgi:signal transduction histidine kinase
VFVLSISYLIGYNYFLLLDASKKNVLTKLKAIACTAALQIDANVHNVLTNHWRLKNDPVEGTEEYRHLQAQLKAVHIANKLESPIYTIIYDSTNNHFEFIVTSAATPYYRHNYAHFPSALIDKFEEGSVLDVYESETGEWLSAFAPIKDDQGKVIGLIQADEIFSTFKASANKKLITHSALALITVLPLIIILFLYIRKFMAERKAYEDDILKKQLAISEQRDIIKTQNEKLEKKNSEIEFINKELENRVKERTISLIKKKEELKTYLYRSSHDMRGPVMSLIGLCKLLKKEEKIDPYASMILHSSLQLAERIQSLAEVYEINTKKVKLTSINVSQLIKEVNESIPESCALNYLVCHDASICTTLIMDEAWVRIIIREALYNSIYHNRLEKKTVRVCVKAYNDANHLHIEIKDNGIGMENSVKERAFEMFYRGNEYSQGIGLGLFKIKNIVDRIKGEFQLHSIKGEETILRILIPFSSPLR